ncbi:hypothetical protein N9M21_03580 [Alphaproteobacteria bacterium]|nr:hypothetical protein [Alphaproteobacteria bacterium]
MPLKPLTALGILVAAVVVLFPGRVMAQLNLLTPHLTCAALAAEAANNGFDLGYGQLEPIQAVKHHANAVSQIVRKLSNSDLAWILEEFEGYPAGESWMVGYLFGAGVTSRIKEIRYDWCFKSAYPNRFNCTYTPFGNWSAPYTESVKGRYFRENCALLPTQ